MDITTDRFMDRGKKMKVVIWQPRRAISCLWIRFILIVERPPIIIATKLPVAVTSSSTMIFVIVFVRLLADGTLKEKNSYNLKKEKKIDDSWFRCQRDYSKPAQYWYCLSLMKCIVYATKKFTWSVADDPLSLSQCWSFSFLLIGFPSTTSYRTTTYRRAPVCPLAIPRRLFTALFWTSTSWLTRISSSALFHLRSVLVLQRYLAKCSLFCFC